MTKFDIVDELNSIFDDTPKILDPGLWRRFLDLRNRIDDEAAIEADMEAWADPDPPPVVINPALVDSAHEALAPPFPHGFPFVPHEGPLPEGATAFPTH
jgi:hypothetical protein